MEAGNQDAANSLRECLRDGPDVAVAVEDADTERLKDR